MARVGLDFDALTVLLTLLFADTTESTGAVSATGRFTVGAAAVAISGGPHQVKKGEPGVDTEDVTGIISVTNVGLETAGVRSGAFGMVGMNGGASML